MNALMKYLKGFLIAFSVIVIGFLIYDIATFEPPTPEFYSIGVSANEIIPVYEGLGFSFADSEPIYDHPLCYPTQVRGI